MRSRVGIPSARRGRPRAYGRVNGAWRAALVACRHACHGGCVTGLQIQIWSDVACPWCFVGKRRLESALAQLSAPVPVSVAYRAFELDPSAPATYPASPSYLERLARKYSVPAPRAAEMIERMCRVGRQEGIAFDFERIQGGNTFDAHRLLWWAEQQAGHAVQSRLKERLLQAYFCEGAAIGDTQALLSIAQQVGLDLEAAGGVLASGEGAAAVREQQRTAARLGISGVPMFVMGRIGVSGAQPADVLLSALRRALGELPSAGAEPDAGVAACTPRGRA